MCQIPPCLPGIIHGGRDSDLDDRKSTYLLTCNYRYQLVSLSSPHSYNVIPAFLTSCHTRSVWNHPFMTTHMMIPLHNHAWLFLDDVDLSPRIILSLSLVVPSLWPAILSCTNYSFVFSPMAVYIKCITTPLPPSCFPPFLLLFPHRSIWSVSL